MPNNQTVADFFPNTGENSLSFKNRVWNRKNLGNDI